MMTEICNFYFAIYYLWS